jgi:dephospho-CoA kinase
MQWIGLTGGIACGKSTVSQILRRRGLVVIDADILAREVVRSGMPAYSEIKQVFGPDAVLAEGGLNRKKIAELVFNDPEKLKILEKITHPRIRILAESQRAELLRQGVALAFYDVPLLFEKNLETGFDRTLVVACAVEVQLARVMRRDGLSRGDAELRLKAQLPMQEKISRANDVIQNNGSLVDLEREVSLYLGRVGGPVN